VGGRPQIAPQRAPQHERHARATRPDERGRQRHAPRRAAHDRGEAPARRQRVDAALARAHVRDAGVVESCRRVVRAPTEQREQQGHALMQRGECAGAIGRHVVGDEQDLRHRKASS
jgi:hypothetical protein